MERAKERETERERYEVEEAWEEENEDNYPIQSLWRVIRLAQGTSAQNTPKGVLSSDITICKQSSLTS